MFPNTESYREAVRHPPAILSEKDEHYGWDSSHPWFEHIIRLQRPRLIIEVGSWLGASAIHMATICRQIGVDAQIICVDTWLGNLAHYQSESYCRSLGFRDGYPTLYYGYLRNVIASGHAEMIQPLPLHSAAAARLIGSQGLRADLVYIDGDHGYDGCLADLRAYAALLATEGLILGDDIPFPGVAAAVAAFHDENPAWRLYVKDNKYLLSRAAVAGLEACEAGAAARKPSATETLGELSLWQIVRLKLGGRWKDHVANIAPNADRATRP